MGRIFKSIICSLIVGVIFLSFLFPKGVQATPGAYCCEAGYSYDTGSNQCQAGPGITDPNAPRTMAITCGPNEWCQANGFFSTCKAGEKPPEVTAEEAKKKACEDAGGTWGAPMGDTPFCTHALLDDGSCPAGFTKTPWGASGYLCTMFLEATTTTGTFIKVGPVECPQSTPDNPVLETAFGCIPTSPQGLAVWIFTFAIFIGGGIAFLFMAWGTFLFITSQGNPEQLQHGKETIVSAGAGLLFIIFSVFLLRLIGVDILRIPGFT